MVGCIECKSNQLQSVCYYEGMKLRLIEGGGGAEGVPDTAGMPAENYLDLLMLVDEAFHDIVETADPETRKNFLQLAVCIGRAAGDILDVGAATTPRVVRPIPDVY